ncbi:helix-turn-helix transcriptional regulator [Terrabacter aerolatus]|uniref:helix-turn-helix transcriptional regulator n=1 Tax=Terrabacter aerolatus TaxID=422442 RepID=UPI0011BF13B3|nr:transcriptional regulator [Terrabacter aerolatus]
MPSSVGGAPHELPALGLGASETADALGLHVTTARFHLERMVAAGVVTTTLRRGSVGRPRKLYLAAEDAAPLATPEALAAFTELLTSAWSAASDGSPTDPEHAGRRWVEEHSDAVVPPPAASAGSWLGKVGAAVDLLEEWGYQPELRTGAGGRTVELTLSACPFLTMARAHPDVVCGIHRGLILGTMAAVGEPGSEVELEPFVTERSCVARLTTTAAFRRPVHR